MDTPTPDPKAIPPCEPPTHAQRLAFWLLFAVHVLLLLQLFPLELLRSNRPITHYDYLLHLHQARTAQRFENNLSIGAYDPLLSAGRPVNVFVPDNNVVNHVAYWGADPAAAVKWVAFLTFLLAPLLVYVTAIHLQMDPWESLLTLLLAVLLCHTDYFQRGLLRWGMFAYVQVCYLAPLTLASWGRLWKSDSSDSSSHAIHEPPSIPDKSCNAGCLFILIESSIVALTLLAHPFGGPVQALLLGLVLSSALLLHRSPRTLKTIAIFSTCIILLTWFANKSWIRPLLANFHYIEMPAALMQSDPRKLVRDLFLGDGAALEPFRFGMVSPALVLAFFLGGIVSWSRALRERAPVWIALALGGSVVLLFYAAGSQLGFGHSEPYRYRLLLTVLWLPPAAWGMAWLLRTAVTHKGKSLATLPAALCVALLVGLSYAPLISLLRTQDVLGKPAHGLTQADELADFVRAWHTDHPRHRVLIEKGIRETDFLYERLAVSDLLEDGVPVHYMPVSPATQFGMASFVELPTNSVLPTPDPYRIFGKPLREWTPQSLRAALELYSIGLLLLHPRNELASSVAKEASALLRQVPGIHEIPGPGDMLAFTLDIPGGFVATVREGVQWKPGMPLDPSDLIPHPGARVRIKSNQIHLECFEPSLAPAILRFHWHESLGAVGDLPLYRQPINGINLPLIASPPDSASASSGAVVPRPAFRVIRQSR